MALKKFKDIHKGETCYIFGDGPSVKWFDYNSFTNHIGFSCGKQIFHKDFDKLNIKYYTIPEPFLFYPKFLQPYKYLRNFDKLTKHLKKEMQKYNKINFFVNLTNLGFINGSNIHFIHRLLYPNHQAFSKTNIDPFSGSFYTCLTLAYHMGFKKVYLIGHDAWTIKKISSQRWFEFGKGKVKKIPKFIEDPYIKFLNNYMEIISIINSNDPINVKSISYEKFSGKNPSYLENDQLTSIKNLKIFDNYPLYNVLNDKT
jgi:hypothetical protein